MKTAIETTPLHKWLTARAAEGRATLGVWLEQRGFDETQCMYGVENDEVAAAALNALDSVRRAARADGMNKATILPGPCATCKGSGKCPICDGQGEVLTEDRSAHTVCYRCEGSGACPDCPPPLIVAREQVVAIEAVLRDERKVAVARDKILAALGPVRMAKAVGVYLHSITDGRAVVGIGNNRERFLRRGDRIAILPPEGK